MRNFVVGLSIIFLSVSAMATSDSQIFQNALKKNDLATVKKLVFEKHFDENQSISDIGETPFTLTALNGNPQILGIISIPKKTKIDHQTTTGWTALMFASRAQSWGPKQGQPTENEKYVQTVQKLLAMGADKNLKNNDGDDALSIAKQAKNEKIVKLLE